MGIAEDTIQNSILLLKHSGQIIENQKEILAAIKSCCSIKDVETPILVEPPHESNGPDPKFVWSDNLKSDHDMPMLFGPSGTGYLHQGLGTMIRTREGLSVDYQVRPWKSKDGPRNEFGRWKRGATSMSYQRDEYEATHWYDFRIKINEREQSPAEDYHKSIHFQIHGPSFMNPILSLNFYPGHRRWVWWARSENRPHRVVWPVEDKPVDQFTGNMVYDTWVQWTIQACWSLTSRGFIRLWRDGALEYETRGETCYNETGQSPYQCMGIYYPDGRKNDPEISFPKMRRHVWLKDFRIGDWNNKLADFVT